MFYAEVDFDVQDGEIFPYQDSYIDEKGDTVWANPVLNKDTKEPLIKVGIRSMTPFFEERMMNRKKAVEHVYNTKTRAMDRITFYPDQSAEEMIEERDAAYNYAITYLEGFKNKKTKKDVDCTYENKIALMKVPNFSRFFTKCQQILDSTGIQTKEEETKNLSTSQSGDPVLEG